MERDCFANENFAWRFSAFVFASCWMLLLLVIFKLSFLARSKTFQKDLYFISRGLIPNWYNKAEHNLSDFSDLDVFVWRRRNNKGFFSKQRKQYNCCCWNGMLFMVLQKFKIAKLYGFRFFGNRNVHFVFLNLTKTFHNFPSSLFVSYSLSFPFLFFFFSFFHFVAVENISQLEENFNFFLLLFLTPSLSIKISLRFASLIWFKEISREENN